MLNRKTIWIQDSSSHKIGGKFYIMHRAWYKRIN